MNSIPRKWYVVGLILFVLCQLLFLDHKLFDWDEINFAESAREMLLTQNFFQVQVNFVPFWQKPPLFLWFQAICMGIFGVSEFAARLPNVVFSALTLISLFRIGKRQKNADFGFLLAALYAVCVFPFSYFKTGIIDPVFNYFILLSIYRLHLAVLDYQTKKNDKLNALWGGVYIGLAILTKGPVGFLLAFITFASIWAIKKLKPILSWQGMLIYGFSALFISSAWFGVETLKNGPWFLKEFFYYQYILLTTPDAGHEQPWFYHFLVVFIGCFPASTLWVGSKFKADLSNDTFRLWMRVLVIVVLLIFTIVKTKIIHYSSLAWFPVVYLAADSLWLFWQGNTTLSKFAAKLTLLIGLFFGAAFTLLPIIGKNPNWMHYLTKDQNVLQALDVKVNWSYTDSAAGMLMMGLLIYWYFFHNQGKKVWAISALGIIFSLTLVFGQLIPKIERYTQGPVIDFLESKKGEDVYIEVLGRSYAHFYYFEKPSLSAFEHKSGINPETNVWEYDRTRTALLFGEPDKPVYLIAKAELWHTLVDYPHFDLLYQEGAFKFLKRKTD